MVHTISRFSRLIPLVALAALSACGGGGGDSTTVSEGIDRYLGDWKGCINYVASDGSSYFTNEVQTVAKVNATAANLQRTLLNKYSDENCSKLSSAYYRQYSSTITLTSPFSLGGLDGHKVIEAAGSYSAIQYIAVDESRTKFYWGAGDVSKSPPTGWSYPYIKQ